jgi:GT2 family glycosyltransferase
VSDNKDRDPNGYANFTHGKDGFWRDGKVQWMLCNWQATSSAGFFMPRRTWDKLGGYDEQFDGCMGAADQEFALRIQKLGQKPNDVKLYLAPYFIHVADEETGSWRMKMIDERPTGRERNEDILNRKHPDAEQWKEIW